ncbi:MAG: hypothetical protein HFH93_05695 [Lachnospiraceae bacterium]|nr:hypothetical protein [Lachnospiraceae bacterium]
MLRGSLSKRGYMRWWHSFSGVQPETGETRTFFVEFFLINPGLGRALPILGQHPYFKKRGMKPSYVMLKAGVFPDEEGNGARQLHAFYPVSALQTTGSPLVMQIQDPCRGPILYSEDRIAGSLEVTAKEARRRSRMTEAGCMEWDVKVQKVVSCHTGSLCGPLAEAFRRLDSFWHGEGIRSFFQGSVVLDGVPYEVTPETSFGYADKHWGRSFNSPWFQFACGRLSSERTAKELRHSVVVLNCLRPRFLFFPLRPRLMLQLTYTGEDFQFTRCKWETKETGRRFIWHVLAQNKNVVVKLSGSCAKKEMLNLRYEDPDGILEREPLQGGCGGIGSLQLYRKMPEGRELLDTLKLADALCIYRGQ